MTKPDGIPQDIWDLAGDCVKRLRLPELLDADFATQEEMDRLTMEIVGEDGLTIAHAIMAEREACAALTEDFARRVMPKDHRSYVFDLAFAIRERGSSSA
jgi:hypothetical protein